MLLKGVTFVRLGGRTRHFKGTESGVYVCIA